MRRAYNRLAAIAAAIAMVGPIGPVGPSLVAPEMAAAPKQIKPRFNAGDQFYAQLSYKRVKGKWSVKR